MILIGLGANLPSKAGAPARTLLAALAELSRSDVSVLAVSPYYENPAWPDPGDPAYVNAVARIETTRSPEDLLLLLRAIELWFGRTTAEKNAPRPLDLDLLDYHGRIQPGPPILPHPRMSERRFVLAPLHIIAPDWRHPVSGLDAAAIEAALPESAGPLSRLADPD